jgi:hypothetical protein
VQLIIRAAESLTIEQTVSDRGEVFITNTEAFPIPPSAVRKRDFPGRSPGLYADCQSHESPSHAIAQWYFDSLRSEDLIKSGSLAQDLGFTAVLDKQAHSRLRNCFSGAVVEPKNKSKSGSY